MCWEVFSRYTTPKRADRERLQATVDSPAFEYRTRELPSERWPKSPWVVERRWKACDCDGLCCLSSRPL